MTRGWFVSVLLVGASISGSIANGESMAPTVLLNQQPKESRNDCGAKSLYLFCRALGMDVTEESVASRCQIQSHGMSMADVASAASDLGVSLQGVYANSSELGRLPFPAIALLEPDGVTGRVGHFVVVTAITDSAVSIVDPQLGSMLDVPLAAFSRASTGCYLIQSKSDRTWVWRIAGVCAFAVGSLGLVWRLRNVGQATALIVLLGCSIGCSQSGHTKTYERRYVLFVERDHLDLGFITTDKRYTSEFQLKNTGKTDLNLDFANSCGCLETKLLPAGVLKAGQSAKLSVVIDPSSKGPGPFIERVVVHPRELPAEERELQIVGRIEGLWVKSNGVTIHLSDAALPVMQIHGFFDSLKPDVVFREADSGLDGLVLDCKHVQDEHGSSALGRYFRWSMPLVAAGDRSRLKRGEYHARIMAAVNGEEKQLSFPIYVLD